MQGSVSQNCYLCLSLNFINVKNLFWKNDLNLPVFFVMKLILVLESGSLRHSSLHHNVFYRS